MPPPAVEDQPWQPAEVDTFPRVIKHGNWTLEMKVLIGKSHYKWVILQQIGLNRG